MKNYAALGVSPAALGRGIAKEFAGVSPNAA